MPNNSGVYVYVDTSTTPWKGVSFDDVRKVLGDNAIDEATLCQSRKINRWAKYKPVAYAGPNNGIHDRRNGWLYPISYSIRKSVNFGLEVPYCIEWNTMDWHSNCMNGMAYDILFNPDDDPLIPYRAWKYKKPQGDYRTAAQDPRAEFFRVSDFARHPSDETEPYPNPSATRYIGYNKNAGLPFEAFLDMGGAKEDTTAGSVNRYNINRMQASQIVMTFFNGRGSEIRLQDFITIPDNVQNITDNDYAWRPVIQVWNNDIIYSTDPQERLPWHQRNKPTLQVAGYPITTDTSSSWSVSLPIGRNTYFDDYVNTATLFRMCVGVGRCKKNLSADNPWYNETDSLFILPYDDEVDGEIFWAFYYEFKVYEDFDRDLQFSKIHYSNGTSNFSGSGVTIPLNATGTVTFTMTILQSDDTSIKPLHFVSENGTPTTNYDALRIALEDVDTHTLYYLEPRSNESGTSADPYAYVPRGSGRTTLYGFTDQIAVQNIPDNTYARYQVKAFIGESTAENANAISIHKSNS